MKKLTLCFGLVAALYCSNAAAQKLKTEQISYSYNRLPAVPTKGITNYQVVLDAAFEARNAQAVKDYQQNKAANDDKYRKDMIAYSAMVKAANERYDKEMAEYNKKTFGKKLAEKALLDNAKPVRETVSKPYLEYTESLPCNPATIIDYWAILTSNYRAIKTRLLTR